jgi:DNA helicase-2/ATP-dependent DNA helicase PcrA
MRVIADLHLHSKYARATSKDTDLEHLAAGAKAKGLNLLGTGDITHGAWLRELKGKLGPISGAGLFTYSGMNWILTGEVSTVYEHEGKTRKIHHLIYAPDLEIVEQIRDALSKHGNLESDGRPVLTGLDSAELVEILTQVSSSAVVIPAHAWTPWFSVFGSKSGFDSLEECFRD